MIGEKIKVGPFIYFIRELRRPDFGGDALEIVLTPDQFTLDSKENILHINFLDETGKSIRTKSKGTIRTTKAHKSIFSLNINPKNIITEIVGADAVEPLGIEVLDAVLISWGNHYHCSIDPQASQQFDGILK